MKTVITYRGAHSFTEFKPEVKNSMVKPIVSKEFFTGKGDERTRMYKTNDGKTFLADVFDRTFNQGVTLKVKPKNFKAKSIDPRMIY